MITKVNHIGIAVNDLDAAIKTVKDVFGLEVAGVEEVPSQKVKVAFVPVGDTRLEFLQPTADDSPVAKFLASRGEGMHHIALETDDILGDLKKAEEGGARLIDKEPRPGAHGTKVGFLHPKSTFGVLMELVEEAGEHRS
ncbi:MAG: methylmalonyl-CoA epimerase [Bacillota bacterium]|jgi:methylmalonyl-CoA/ethylmalonyl-CoA epimerase|nr:methylmalonyl-CoA epimerase [Candidatus Fermentithermobacillaceae bacterium]